MNDFREKLEGYLKKAAPLFENLSDASPAEVDIKRARREFREMALAYYKDAKHFHEKGEYANALASLEYAEGWMDAGKRLGIFR